MKSLKFDNRFVAELPGDPEQSLRRRQVTGAAWSAVEPTPVAAPRLVAWAPEVARLVGLTEEDAKQQWFADVFGGNALMPGMQPYAACYGGHQFGNWAGQLGDGRAITLGEVVNGAGERWELQLKGAGPTPYSRTADGRAVLRSSIREFVCSEAMFHLGVPTTRALSLVVTGDEVMRDMFYDGNVRPEPGAIVCRVAPSFIRFGNFEIFTSRQDHENLARLVDFAIDRDFPHLGAIDDIATRRARWLAEVAERTATLMVHWMRVGFVHGVMNTDNMSILGLTIDYGPYGWLDDFDPTWTPNTTDAGGRRYRYGQQPAVAQWNLMRLCEAVAPLFVGVADGVAPLQAAIDAFAATFTAGYQAMTAAKFGFAPERAADEAVQAVVQDGFTLLYEAEVDFTLFFRALGEIVEVGEDDAAVVALLGDIFYDEEKRRARTGDIASWLQRWWALVGEDAEPHATRRARMHAVNPRYVLRNYLAQEAIDLAERGEYGMIETLLDAMRRPYDEQPQYERFAAKRPEWARHRAGSSMLSCSS